MAQHCQAGDIPTVYYSFSGQPRQNVTFHLSPIDVQTMTAEEEAKEKEPDTSGGPCYPNGAPRIGTPCNIVYSSWMDWWASDVSALGEGDTTGAGGGVLPPEEEAHITYIYYSEQISRDDPDGWRYTWTYALTDITETDEYGTHYKFFYVVNARKRFYFNGQPPTEKPSPYEALGDSATWGLLSDSCGWTGNLNCRMDAENQLPPPPENKDKCIIKVLHNGAEIWRAEGKCPGTYDVACKNDCPPGYLKLKANNPKGFCCIPCKEVQSEAAQIKSLLRQRNG